MHTTAPQASAPTSWCMIGNPDFPVTLGIVHQLITTLTSKKYIQKLRDYIKWAQRKANLFQWKKAQCHKQNYDRHSNAVFLRMGDMALVCVTTFKGRHKIQSRWENREYVVGWQPYSNLLVYVVHSIDRWGNSCTLHRNYLLPISDNLEQKEGDNSRRGDGSSDEPTPVPHDNGGLLSDHPTKSLLEGMHNSPSKQHEPFHPGSTSTDPTDGGLQADNDAPVPPRWSSRTMRNQPSWRYRNFALQQNDILPSASNIWVGLCICLHIISCAHGIHWEYSLRTLYFNHHKSAQHKFLGLMGIPSMLTLWWIFGLGSGPKDIWSMHSCPTGETKKATLHRGTVGKWAVWPWRQCA